MHAVLFDQQLNSVCSQAQESEVGWCRLERLLGSLDTLALEHGLAGVPAEQLHSIASTGAAARSRLQEALLCLRTAFTMGQDGSIWPVMRLLVPLTRAQGGPLLADMKVGPAACPLHTAQHSLTSNLTVSVLLTAVQASAMLSC